MCGRLNTSDDPVVQGLMTQLGLPLDSRILAGQQGKRFTRATDKVTVIREKNGQRALEQAVWWLLLERTETGFKPSKYTSFNTRYDKLNIPRSAGFKPFRESRCIIPAKGFGETEFVNKKPLHYYDFEAVDGEALAFGGLCKEWTHSVTGEVVLSCSVITLPPHDKLKHIHSKAMPLILPQDDDTMDMWLDSKLQNVDVFNDLLRAHLPQNLIAYQIDKPSLYNPIGTQKLILSDAV